MDLCQRIRAGGLPLLSDPRIESVHHGDPQTLRALFRSELWRGRDNLRVSLRRPIAWAALPSALLPVFDAGLLAVAGPALILRHRGPRNPGVVAALLLIAVGSLGRKAWAAVRSTPVPSQLLRVFVVVLVYGMARAFALVTRARHRDAPGGPQPQRHEQADSHSRAA